MSDDRMPVLSIVSVLYGGRDVLERTLPTWRQAVGPDIEVVFVDHSVELLDDVLHLSAWARYEWDPANPGFAAGVNRAVELARGDRVFLLNPDVFLTAEALSAVVAAPDRSPYALTLRTDGVDHRGIEYTWWGFCRDRTEFDRPLVGASGGAAVFPRALVHDDVPFPSHLFAWGEDAEWALRLRARGVVTRELDDVVLDHVGGHSVADLDGQRFKARLLVRNRIATFRSAFSLATKVIVAVPFFAAIAANVLRKIQQRTARAYLRGVVDGFTMRLPASELPAIRWREWRAITARPEARS